MLFASNIILVNTFFLNIIQSIFELLFKNIRVFVNCSFCKCSRYFEVFLTLFTNQMRQTMEKDKNDETNARPESVQNHENNVIILKDCENE